MADPGSSGKRPYKMKARATATEATRAKILEASETAFDELQFDEITLAAVAQRADVSVQTVIRHFGSKEGLFVATLQHLAVKMGGDRAAPVGGDPKEIVGDLVDHYETFGDRLLKALSQEERVPALGVLVELGRQYHVVWCKQAFKPALAGLRGAPKERRTAQLVAVTDIYVWKILRRDRGLSPAQAKLAMLELVEPLAEGQR